MTPFLRVAVAMTPIRVSYAYKTLTPQFGVTTKLLCLQRTQELDLLFQTTVATSGIPILPPLLISLCFHHYFIELNPSSTIIVL